MEDNFVDVVQPAATFDPYRRYGRIGNDMLAVSRGLEAKTDVRFASAVRLDNGQVRFKYEEDVSGSVQDGLMEVPQKFAVGIPVFAGTEPVADRRQAALPHRARRPEHVVRLRAPVQDHRARLRRSARRDRQRAPACRSTSAPRADAAVAPASGHSSFRSHHDSSTTS
jgi:hypothetical protein